MAEHRPNLENGNRVPPRPPGALAKAPAADPGADPNGDSAERARELAERYRVEFVDLAHYHINHDLFRSIPVDLMFRYNFVPLEELAGGRLAIAVADPSRLMTIDEIGLLLGKRIVTRVATLAQIEDLLKKTEQSQRVLEEAGESFMLDVIHEDETGDETISIERLTEESDISPIIRLVDTTIFTALQRRASDIHIETRDDAVQIKYRIDGVLQPAMQPIAREHHSTIISRVKVMSELDIAERRVPQDGRFRVRYNNRFIDFRVSIMPSIHGEDAVLRVLDKESMSEKFHQLNLDVVGFEAGDLKRFRRYIAEPYGMVLVTGPTGSGKTTTLYAALNEIKTDEDKIITIEDPVEYQIRGVTQIPVNEKKGLTFARGLRSVLRHDPDKIMVGEIRDTETAQIAINSALTGHLVFTTVHANNVVDVIGRFLNMGVEPYNFVSSLNCILAQRLVRVICDSCRHPVEYSKDVLEASGLDPKVWGKVKFFEGAGCIECGGTGFRGRTAIHELLELSDRIREMILAKRPGSEIRRAANEEGMKPLRESALLKVRAGVTTLKEVNKVTFIEEMR
jgi:type II secretory ATPase GspE/PulE/Tfp pilus assembly ATPase PilB-like protein